RQRTQHHAVVSEERFHTSDRFRLIVVEAITRIARLHDPRHRQKRFEFLCTATGTATWSTATVWSREGLVKIEMDYVNAHVAGARDTHECVHVRTVHV